MTTQYYFHSSTKEQLEKLHLTDILTLIAHRRVTWVEHHLRNPDALTDDRIRIEMQMGSRWWAGIEKSLEENGRSWEEIEEEAEWLREQEHGSGTDSGFE